MKQTEEKVTDSKGVGQWSQAEMALQGPGSEILGGVEVLHVFLLECSELISGM